MKNTELIKLENILEYKGEFDKISPLSKEYYNAREAAKIFGCTMSQIKGYLNNYKQHFTESVEVVGTPGKQETRITPEGMFLLAILLDKKSTLAHQVANAVRNLIANESTKQKETKEEPVQLEMDLDKIKIEKLVVKNGKITKEEEIEVSKEDLKNESKIEDIINDLFNKEKTKEEQKETLDTNSNNEEDEKEKFRKDMLLHVINRIEQIKEKINEEDESLLESEINKALLKLSNRLYTNNTVLDSYMDKCRILGLEELESAIMLQEAFISEKDPDKIILNALYKKEKEEMIRKRGVLRESIELLASEKFNGEIKDTYHYLSNELRFYMGINMKKIRDKQKFARVNPTSYLDIIINENAYEHAMEIIATLLAE